MSIQSKNRQTAYSAGKRGRPMQVVIGVSFASDWSREWREFSGPIIEQNNAKTMKSRITFDAQSRIALRRLKINCYNTFCLVFVSLAFRGHTTEGMTVRSEM